MSDKAAGPPGHEDGQESQGPGQRRGLGGGKACVVGFVHGCNATGPLWATVRLR